MKRNRALPVATALGTGLLGASLAAPVDSPRFYGLTAATAATWVAGGLAGGGVPRGRPQVVGPVLTGVGAFGVFYAGALVARRIPPLRRALSAVLGFSRGSGPLVVASTLASGAAEEVFFRGALQGAIGARGALGAYVVVTAATGNPALVAAATAMGAVWGQQRRRSGGIQAPLLTHVTWSALMLRFLPPLFVEPGGGATRPPRRRGA